MKQMEFPALNFSSCLVLVFKLSIGLNLFLCKRKIKTAMFFTETWPSLYGVMRTNGIPLLV